MLLRFVRVEDVHDAPAARFEKVRDQGAMAAPPDGFRAHDRGAPFARENGESVNRARELRRFHVIGIRAECRVPPSCVA